MRRIRPESCRQVLRHQLLADVWARHDLGQILAILSTIVGAVPAGPNTPIQDTEL
jgi:hypothetical protein